jgi:hypothetical protein
MQEHCALMALPCGTTITDVENNKEKLNESFIKYLTSKAAAGIVNVSANVNLADPVGNLSTLA